MQRTRLLWEGLSGGLGYSNFYSRVADPGQHDPSLAAQDIANFLNEIRLRIPGDVTWRFETDIPVISDVDGEAQDFLVLPAQPTFTQPGGSGTYAAPTGAVVTWNTGTTIGGRRLRGRTYLVPMVSSTFEGDGTLSASAITTLADAAAHLYSTNTAQHLVWSRPAPGRAGTSWPIQSHSVADKAAILRSRRD